MDLRLPSFVRSRDLSWLKYIQYIYLSSKGGKYNAIFSTMLLFSQPLPPTSLFLCIRELPSPTIPILLASEQQEEQNALFTHCSLVPPWLRQILLCSCVPLHCNRLPSMWKWHILHLVLFFNSSKGQCYDKRQKSPLKKNKKRLFY